MGRPERVVDVDVGVRRERRREGRVVLLLLGVEAEVLEERASPGRRRLTASSVPTPSASPVTGTFRRMQLVSRWPTGRSASPSWTLPSGRPRWLREDDPRARALSSVAIVGIAARIRESSVTLPSRERDVEVDADEDALARRRRRRGWSACPCGLSASSAVGRRSGQRPGSRAATNAMRSATRQL